MGVWGPRNFDSDVACDYLAIDVLGPLKAKMKSVLDDPKSARADDHRCDTIVAAVEALAVLCEQMRAAVPPPSEVVEKCRDAFLAQWDATIDEVAEPGHKEERRAVIVSTFDQLIEISKGG